MVSTVFENCVFDAHVNFGILAVFVVVVFVGLVGVVGRVAYDDGNPLVVLVLNAAAVFVGVALVKFLSYLVVNHIAFVLAFPISPVLPQHIFQRSVGGYISVPRPRIDHNLRHHEQPFGFGILVQKVVESDADGGFLFGSAKVDNVFLLAVVVVDLGEYGGLFVCLCER